MTDRSATYNLAGLVVRTTPDALAQVRACLSALPGVEVHHEDPATGRLVVTLEGAGTFDRERFEEIRRQPGVVSAELVYHYAEPDTGGDADGLSNAGEC